MSLVHPSEHHAMSRGFGTKEFGELLETAMVRESKEVKKTSFAPSGLGYAGSCPRMWFYAFNGAMFEYDTAAPAMANMEAGTDAGKRLANVLDKAGILIDSEIKVTHNDPPIFGYIDAMVRWKDEVIVVEVKTTKSASWNYRATSNSVPGYQMVQLLIYMHLTGKEKGFFMTENKDTHEIFILPVKMDDEKRALVEYVLDWMRKVKKNADEGELPTRPFTNKSMQCKGCPVRNTCWEGWVRTNKTKGVGADPAPGVVDLPVLEMPK